MKVRNQKKKANVGLDMTSMIDIVFQLLIFFIMTFKIVAPEGDFNVKMPKDGPDPIQDIRELTPPIIVKMEATENGELAAVSFGSEKVSQMIDLRSKVLGVLGGGGGGPVAASFTVELDCDPKLQYKYVIEAITYVSGQRQDDKIVPLIENIKFTAPTIVR